MEIAGSRTPQPDNVAWFFTDPLEAWQRHDRSTGARSVLFMVRQDAMDTFRAQWDEVREIPLDRVPERDVIQSPQHFRRLFATSMVVFAGIDLLGKFLGGDDCRKRGEVGRRFKQFAQTYMDLPESEAGALFAVRNTIMHSFGLYDRDGKHRVKVKSTCDSSPHPPVTASRQDWVLCIQHLYLSFVVAVERYHTDIQADPVLRGKFEKMFKLYGFVHVGAT